jgi:prepilin-type N-terminal cleavage/methylation domain-containing protein
MRRKTAFTLIEMLVVVGIIVLIVGIAAPMIYRAYKSGSVARLKADLAAISTALEAYKNDHGDYPRADVSDAGAAILGKALIGPGDRMRTQTTSSGSGSTTTLLNPPTAWSSTATYKPGEIVKQGTPSPSTDLNSDIYVCVRECVNKTPPAPPLKYNEYWTNVSSFDGADGPGFRVRPEIAGTAQGKPVGPYLNAGRIPMRGMAFVDAQGNAILYFAGSPSKGNFAVADNGTTTPGGYLTVFQGANNYADPRTSKLSRFNARDNIAAFRREGDSDYSDAIKRIAGMLGDFGGLGANETSDSVAPDGAINNSFEKAVDANYLLWCAGPDGLFGPTTITGTILDFRTKELPKCDDVTNFR